jgi:hypothetical protein
MCVTVDAKKMILSSLFLLTCLSMVFAQTDSSRQEKLVTKFIKLEKLRIPSNVSQTPPYKTSPAWIAPTKEQKAAFRFMFHSLLSEQGSTEIDSKENILIVTDTKNRAEFIKGFVTILDSSGFTFDEFIPKSIENAEKLAIETVEIHILPVGPYCDVGEELHYANLYLKHDLLIKTIEEIRVRVKPVQIDTFRKGFELTGTQKRIDLAKNIIALFEQANFD